MKTKMLLIITLFAACIIPSISQAEKAEGVKEKPTAEQVFKKLDKDNNGTLSLQEFKASMEKKTKKAKKAKAEDSEEE